MVLICISLMANDVQHLLKSLVDNCVFSLEKPLFRCFALFKIGLSFCCYELFIYSRYKCLIRYMTCEHFLQFMSYLFFLNKFICLFLAALGLCCCAWAFSSCGEQGPLLVAVCGLLIAVACLCCRVRALGAWASVVVAHGLSSCGLQGLERRLSNCGARA